MCEEQVTPKKLKTWDEAIGELNAFILKSKKEEQAKANQVKEEKENQQ